MGSICDENGVPVGISLALSGLTRCTVSKKTGKYLLTDEVSGIATEYMTEELQSLLKKADIEEITGEGVDLLEKLAKNSEKIIESVKQESEVIETAVKKGGVDTNSIGGTIMEQTLGGKVFDNWKGLQGMYPEWDTVTDLNQKPIWDALSSQYASGAEGVATYVHPSGYEGDVWSNIEKTILEENDNIIQEVIIDAK